MKGDEVSDDGKPKAQAFRAGAFARMNNSGELFFVEPRAIVSHDEAGRGRIEKRDADCRVQRTLLCLRSISQQIDDDEFKFQRVAQNAERTGSIVFK